MINVIIDVGENTRMVELADILAAIRAAGFDYRVERQPVDALAAYRQSLLETQRLAGELRRAAEHRVAEEQAQGIAPLPRARFGNWWETP